MLCNQILSNDLPIVHPEDFTEKVMSMMEDNDVQSLPVVSEDKYLGLVELKDLQDIEEDIAVAKIEMQLNRISVKPEDHFLAALKTISEANINVLPVVGSDGIYEGTIQLRQLVLASAQLSGLHEFQGALIVLEFNRNNFSLSEISRLVELNEAQITEFNSYTEENSGLYIVTLRLNKTEVSNIVSTFQRHEFQIRYYFGEENYQNSLKENYDALLHYLNI